jgi:S1-C subfamily serine protease
MLQASGDGTPSAASPDSKPSKQGSGTAFAVSNEGHALTNHHVINGCTEVKVAGRDGVAKVITSDSVNDLALLQLPGKTKDIANLNPDPGKLRQGEDIIVFGYPLDSVLSSGGNLTPGTLSALTGLGNNTNQIQITAPIQPGSSGSPVMDKKGDVVGAVSMKLSDSKMAKATGSIGQNVNFAVNGQTVKAFLDANKVPYKIGGGLFSREKSNADIAEQASKWTVLVECWK